MGWHLFRARRSARRSSETGDDLPDARRRGLVLGASAASVALGVPAASASEHLAPEPPRDRRTVSYRETEHVRLAYRRMRF